MKSTFNSDQITGLISGRHHDPFSVLGAHPVSANSAGVIVRVFIPGAKTVKLLDLPVSGSSSTFSLDNNGFFETFLEGVEKIFPYRIEVDFGSGVVSRFYDCYSFVPVISEYDLFLFNQGNHDEIYNKLGAHPMVHQGIKGTLFAVWAPSAARVSVVGDFNQWNGLRHQMRIRGSSGIWELFIPHLGHGLLYKFEILTQDGAILTKFDPYGFVFEKSPKTAAIVHDFKKYEWTDHKWMSARENKNLLQSPLAVYEIHLGSWKRKAEEGGRFLSYKEAAAELVPYVKEMGFTHIQLLPLAEHPFDGSWGYQVTGYYAVTSRFGTPEDFMYFVDFCHSMDLGVIMDWVPAHFPGDPHALEYFDGTHLYEHADPRQGRHRDWDTLIFNYGRNEVKNFLVANALFWLDKYHIDGFRVDAVASMLYLDYSRKDDDWLPNCYGGRENLEAIEFLKTFNRKVFDKFPGVATIAEESTSWPGVTSPVHMGGLGFLFKWNMGWMNDMLTFISKDPVHRKYYMNNLTFALLYAFHENFMLSLSHDEVVHGKASLLSKMPGDDWQKFANLRLLLGYMYAEPGKKNLFMGGEFGQWKEWNHDFSLDWHLLDYEPHKALARFVRDLNKLYVAEPALYELDFDPDGFEWIDFRDADSVVVSFIRKTKDSSDILLFAFNFTPVPRYEYRIGAPTHGFYRELINSDASCYGGSNVGLGGGVFSDRLPWHGQPCSVCLTLPPLGMLLLKPEK